MTILLEGLVQHLKDDGGVSALISDRIVPQIIESTTTLPAIAYQKVTGPRSYSHSGAGLAFARVQLTFVAATPAASYGLAEAVRAALSGHRGDLGGVAVGRCFLENELDQWAAALERVVVRHDYSFLYEDA